MTIAAEAWIASSPPTTASSTEGSLPITNPLCGVCGQPLTRLLASFYVGVPADNPLAAAGPRCLSCLGPASAAPPESPPPDDAQLTRRLRRCRIPAADWHLGLADLDADADNAEAVLAVNGWLQEGGALFLCGPVGSGKTTLAVAAAAEMARRGDDVRFWRMSDVELVWNGEFRDPARQAMLRDMQSQAALVLDDLGIESATDSMNSLLHTALEGRLRGATPLLITSNLMPSEAGQRYGTWIASRLSGACKPLRLGGRDRRLDPRNPN